MTHHLSKIIYINIDKRTDRREQIENELVGLDYERFPAFHTPGFGILGCTMSHLAVLKLAKERGYDNVLVLEDDFYFIITRDQFEKELDTFFQLNISYDVCMISYHIEASQKTEEGLEKIISAQTASGYIVHHSYYDTLIALYEEAVPLLNETRQHWIYANDQIWKRLQPTSNWYAITRCGKQRPGFSDNSNSFQTYDC
jgi:glycosyl transferase family 25